MCLNMFAQNAKDKSNLIEINKVDEINQQITDNRRREAIHELKRYVLVLNKDEIKLNTS